MQDELREKWIKSISRYQQYEFYTKYFLICQQHFQPHDFVYKNERKVLRHDAVPSIFINSSPLPADNAVQPESMFDNRKFLCCKINNCSNQKKTENDYVSYYR